MKELRISSEAERDLHNAWQYLTNTSTSAEIANRFIDRLIARLSVLGHTPKAGLRRDTMGVGLRALPVGNYIVYYRESERSVTISRVIHGKREQASAFSEEPES